MLRGLRRLSAAQWRVLINGVGLALVVETGIRLLKLPTLARLLRVPIENDAETAGVTSNLSSVMDRATYERLVITYKLMNRWPFDEKCLRRSLVTAVQIRRVHPVLIIGVAIAGEEVMAHAWLRVGGIDLDPAAREFGPLRTMDAA